MTYLEAMSSSSFPPHLRRDVGWVQAGRRRVRGLQDCCGELVLDSVVVFVVGGEIAQRLEYGGQLLALGAWDVQGLERDGPAAVFCAGERQMEGLLPSNQGLAHLHEGMRPAHPDEALHHQTNVEKSCPQCGDVKWKG